MNIRNLLLVLLILSVSGCTTVSKSRNLEKQVALLQEAVSRKSEELKLKEGQLKEKDRQITELRKKLEGFGVFQ